MHGTMGRYQFGCRCRDCKDAAAETQREYTAKVRERVKDPEDPIHGTPTGYRKGGCRCRKCYREVHGDRSYWGKLLSFDAGSEAYLNTGDEFDGRPALILRTAVDSKTDYLVEFWVTGTKYTARLKEGELRGWMEKE